MTDKEVWSGQLSMLIVHCSSPIQMSVCIVVIVINESLKSVFFPPLHISMRCGSTSKELVVKKFILT